MKKSLLSLLLLTAIAGLQGFSMTPNLQRVSCEDGNPIPSVLQSATVYRNGAELVHTAKTSLRQGNNSLVIEDISSNVDVNSIRIGSTGNVTVLSVEFSKEYLKPETRTPLIKKLQDSLDPVQRELEKVNVLIRADMDMIDLLASNKKIGGEQNGSPVRGLVTIESYLNKITLDVRSRHNCVHQQSRRLKHASR